MPDGYAVTITPLMLLAAAIAVTIALLRVTPLPLRYRRCCTAIVRCHIPRCRHYFAFFAYDDATLMLSFRRRYDLRRYAI